MRLRAIVLIFSLLASSAWAQNVMVAYAPTFPDHYLGARVTVLPGDVIGLYGAFSYAGYSKPPGLMKDLSLYGQALEYKDFRTKIDFGLSVRVSKYFALTAGVIKLYKHKEMMVDARRFERHDGVEVITGKIYPFIFSGHEEWQTGTSLGMTYFADQFVHLLLAYSSAPRGLTAGFGISVKSLYTKI